MRWRWRVNEDPPALEKHSVAKLEVLRTYLSAYFDKLAINPKREQFKLDIVDGFCGGGTFLNEDKKEVPGSPLIILEEAKKAKQRLNQERRKPLDCDFKYHFVDIKKEHTNFLRKSLESKGYKSNDITIHNSDFCKVANKIIVAIKSRQPRSGRSIFLLDQTGYSNANLLLVAEIFKKLPAAEVILTYAAEALVNLLSQKNIIRPPGIDEITLKKIVAAKEKSEINQRAIIQRLLREDIRTTTGANFDTPFFIRPEKSRRALWFIHLSNHPTARNVMMRCHWLFNRAFEHYGPGGFGMLGYDSIIDRTLDTFDFGQFAEEQMKRDLVEGLIRKIYPFIQREPITFEALCFMLANESTATFDHIAKILISYASEKEIVILDEQGKQRRVSKNIRPTDRIALPDTLLLFPRIK